MACVALVDRVFFKDFNMLSGMWFHTYLCLAHLFNVPNEFVQHFDTYLVEPYETPFSVHVIYGLHFIHALLSALYDPYADSVAIKIHHVVHMFLLSVSYVFGYIPIGIMVMLLHDYSDILMFAMRKYEHHSKYHKYILFVLLLIVWSYTRVVKFDSVIKRAWVTQNQLGHVLCLFALRLLWWLNVFWLAQLARRGYKAIMREFW